MKPTLKTKVISKTIQYWDCGEGHAHRTKEIAEKCINARENKGISYAAVYTKEERKAQSVAIFRRVLDGETIPFIAKDLGLTQSLVKSRYDSAKWYIEKTRKDLDFFIETRIEGVPFGYNPYGDSMAELRSDKHKQFWLDNLALYEKQG